MSVITTVGTYKFKNRTNGDILIQRLYMDDYTYFSLDLSNVIPDGAKKYTLTLDNQISKSSDATGEFKWIVNNVNSGYSPAIYSSSASHPGWVRSSPNDWPLFAWHASSGKWFVHPQRGDGNDSVHYGCVLRWVADKGGKVTVRSRIKHGGGGFGGVHGMVVHCLRGSSGTKPDPSNWSSSGKVYLNTTGWNAKSGVGYTRQAFGGVDGAGGPVQANLVSNWHPRKLLSNATGSIPSQGQMTLWTGGTSTHTSLTKGNVDMSSYQITRVSGPHYAFAGGQGGYEPVKCRYIRWYPMTWHSHPTARVGAYNPTDKWDLGATGCTLTSNSVWGNDHHGHGAANGYINHASKHSNWSAASSSSNQAGHAYIQQDFGSVKEVTQLASQGRHANAAQWVTSWLIFASTDGTNWFHINKESGGPWNPDFFTKELTVKEGDWIDMIVEAGDKSSAYDSTFIDHDITYVQAGTGPNGDQYIDSNGRVRNTSTDAVDGIELEHDHEINIPVRSSTTKTSLKGYNIHLKNANLSVDYKCDKLLESGSQTAFIDAISPETHEVKSLTAKGWFEIKSYSTGKSITLYIPDKMLAGKGLRWCFSVEFGWIYLAPKINPFDATGCWIFKAQSTDVGSQYHGWMWMVLDHLPRIYAKDGPGSNWFMLGKASAQSYLSPAYIWAEHVQNGANVTQLRYRYRIYNNFLSNGWGTAVEKNYISTGASTPRNSTDIYSRIPPDHTKAGLELGFGGKKTDWWGDTTAPTPGAEIISKDSMYKVNKTTKMPLTKMWYDSWTTGAQPESVAFMCRDGGSGGDWIVLYGYSNWNDRVNNFKSWRTLDNKHKLQLEQSGQNYYWTLHTPNRKFTYRPDDGMEKVEMVFNGTTVYASKFPGDGSYYYRHKLGGVPGGGKWIPSPGPGGNELMFYFVYHKPGERNKMLSSFNEIGSSSRASSAVIEMTGRPDIRTRNVNSMTYGTVRGFDYDVVTLNDAKGADLQTNSRLLMFLTNCTSGGNATQDSTPILVRETHATIDCSAATVSGTGELIPGKYMRCKLIYPGYGARSYGESGFFGLGKTPTPQLEIDISPQRKNGTQNGYVVAAAKYHSPTTGYMDCGYDTKNLVKISGNGYTEEIGNLPPEQTGGPTRSGQAWLGLKVEGGNTKKPGTILYNGEKLTAGQYKISMYNYGDQDNYTWTSNVSQHLDIQLPTHLIGHLGAKFMAYGPASQPEFGAAASHTLMFGGNETHGTWNTTNQCCDSNGFHVTNDRNCLDYKTPVLNDPDQIMFREGRNANKWDIMVVRYVDSTGSGALQYRADSGPLGGSNGWGLKTAYRDTNGPTRLKFHNWHPFSSVWVKIEARVAYASDDAAGLTIGAWSTTRGKIFDPFDHNNAYLYCSWDKFNMWPHNFSGGDFGATSPGSGSGVHNFVGGRTGLSNVINTSTGDGISNITTKNFGYFKILSGETITFALYGCCNLGCHGGYGQYEGTAARWFKLTPHSWPEDPD